MICDECQAMYEEVGERAREAGVFKKVRRTDDALMCWAKHVDSEAIYKVQVHQPAHDCIYVGLYTPDRWLSESIEADALHRGDKFEELIEEELVDLGGKEGGIKVEHFRNDEKVFVFRTVIPVASQVQIEKPDTIDHVAKLLLAYEAAFRELGDMAADDERV